MEKNKISQLTGYFEDIVNTVRMPMLILDADLRVVFANRFFYKFFKVSPEKTEKQLIYNLGNHQWDIPKLREVLERILPQKKTLDDFEVEHDFKDVGKLIMLLNARILDRNEGETPVIFIVFEDITERVQMKKEMEASEELFRRLFETSLDGLILFDKYTGLILKSNFAVQKMLGYSEGEFLGKKMWEIGIIPDANKFKNMMQELLDNGKISRKDVEVINKAGHNLKTEVFYVDRATAAHCNIHTITTHKVTENEKKY